MYQKIAERKRSIFLRIQGSFLPTSYVVLDDDFE